MKKNVTRNIAKDSLVAISSEYLVWIKDNQLFAMYIPDSSSITVKLPELQIKCLCIHGNVVATGGAQDFKVNLYDLKTGDLIESYEGLHAQVNSVAITDKYVIATSYAEQLLWKRNCKSEPPTHFLGTNYRNASIATDGVTVMLGSNCRC